MDLLWRPYPAIGDRLRRRCPLCNENGGVQNLGRKSDKQLQDGRTTPEDAQFDEFSSGQVPIASVGLPLPPRSHTPRDRLYRLLDNRRPLTTITGAAGFGKTTLVSGWLTRQRNSRRVAWIGLEGLANDPRLLLSHLIAAINRVHPSVCEAAHSMLSDIRSVAPRLIMTSLLNGLAQQDGGWTIVLDDYPVSDAITDELIAYVGDHLPANVSMIILSRGEPDLPLSRWRVRQKLTEIGIADLRFTPRETKQFIDRMGLVLDPPAIETLDRRADGWAAGLQLAAVWLSGRDRKSADVDIVAFDGGHRFVSDYLVSEVFERQSEAIRRFLLATSAVEQFSAALCDGILGGDESVSIIDELLRRGLFLIAVDHYGKWYRYHHLFRDFLRAKLDARTARQVHSKASVWFEAQHRPDEAIQHACAAGETERAKIFVKTHIETELSNGRFDRVLQWLTMLPEAAVRNDADLAGYTAWLLYMRGRLGEAEKYSDAVAGTGHALHRQTGPLLAFQAFLAINRGYIGNAELAASDAIEKMSDENSFFGPLAMFLLGVAQRIGKREAAAVEALRRAIRTAEAQNNILVRLEATSELIPLLFASGRLRECIRLCEHAINETEPQSRGKSASALLHIRYAQMLYEVNELDRAQKELEHGLRLSEQLGNTNYLCLGKRHLAMIYYATDQPELARAALAEAAQFADRAEHSRQRRLIDLINAEFHLREGNVTAASHLVGSPTDVLDETSTFEQFVNVRLLIAQDRPRIADAMLSRMEVDARHGGRYGELFPILLLRSLTAEGRGDRMLAERQLMEALAVGAPLGFTRTLIDLGPSIAKIIVRLDPVPAYARKIVEKISVLGEGEKVAPSNITPLTNTEHQILELLAQGMSNRSIASRLNITIGTTKWHIHHIYEKLDVSSRTAAVFKAREINILQ